MSNFLSSLIYQNIINITNHLLFMKNKGIVLPPSEIGLAIIAAFPIQIIWLMQSQWRQPGATIMSKNKSPIFLLRLWMKQANSRLPLDALTKRSKTETCYDGETNSNWWQTDIFIIHEKQVSTQHCEFEELLRIFLLSKYLGSSKWKNEILQKSKNELLYK